MKYTKEIMKVDNYSGRDDEELNKVIKEIDDLEEKEREVVCEKLHSERRIGNVRDMSFLSTKGVYFISTKYIAIVTIIEVIIGVYFIIKHPLYLFHIFFVICMACFITSIVLAKGYNIFRRSMYEGEKKRIKRLEKREKDISEKLRSLYKLKNKLEIKVMNNKANADLLELDYDKEKIENKK